MFKRYIIILIIPLLISCSNEKVTIFIEQPSEQELNNVSFEIIINDKKIYNKKLKTTNIASIFDDVYFDIEESKNYKLKVKVGNESFEYELIYPDNKYIVLSPFYKEGKVFNGILKKKEKITLH